MHIVGDLQRNPNKRRAFTEKILFHFHNLISFGMLCTIIVGTAIESIRSTKTFNHNMWKTNVDLQLAEPLYYATLNCKATVSYDSYGYGAFEAGMSGQNVLDALIVLAYQIRTNLIIAIVVLVLGALNRILVEENFFFVRYRNFVFRKSTITTIELFLAIVGIVGVVGIEKEARPIRDFLKACNITSTRTLAFGSPLNFMYVFYAFEFFGFFVGTIMLLGNGLSKPHPEVLEEWTAEQFELIKPPADIDTRRNQIVVAADGTTLGRAVPGEIEEIRRRRSSVSPTRPLSPTPAGGKITGFPNSPGVANNNTNRQQLYSPQGTNRFVDRSGATPLSTRQQGFAGNDNIFDTELPPTPKFR